MESDIAFYKRMWCIRKVDCQFGGPGLARSGRRLDGCERPLVGLCAPLWIWARRQCGNFYQIHARLYCWHCAAHPPSAPAQHTKRRPVRTRNRRTAPPRPAPTFSSTQKHSACHVIIPLGLSRCIRGRPTGVSPLRPADSVFRTKPRADDCSRRCSATPGAQARLTVSKREHSRQSECRCMLSAEAVAASELWPPEKLEVFLFVTIAERRKTPLSERNTSANG